MAMRGTVVVYTVHTSRARTGGSILHALPTQGGNASTYAGTCNQQVVTYILRMQRD